MIWKLLKWLSFSLFSHTPGATYNGGGLNINETKAYTGASQIAVDEAVGIGATDLAISLSLDVSAMTAIVILADQVLTLEWNDTSGTQGSFVTKANIPYIWNTDSYDACLIDADVTQLYATNASGVAARLRIAAVTDPTP